MLRCLFGAVFHNCVKCGISCLISLLYFVIRSPKKDYIAVFTNGTGVIIEI